MSLFDLKAVTDPLTGQLNENFRELMLPLQRIQEAVELQNELTQTTNRLLAALVEQGARPGAKKPAVKP